MLNQLVKFLLLSTLFLSAYASPGNGLNQEYLISVFPEVNSINSFSDTTIRVELNQNIDLKSVRKNTVVLKKGTSAISGKVSVENSNILIFTPDVSLEKGTYNVSVKKVKLDFPKVTQTDKILFSFDVPTLTSIEINKNDFDIKEGETTTLMVTAKFDNGIDRDLSDNIEWIVSNNSVVSVDEKGLLKALNEGETTLQAKYKGMTSASTHVTVFKEINGYRLPPEPDAALNNSTILGIDSNDNGIRDDVEIYVIKKFVSEPKFPKTKTAISLQAAWASQRILETPIAESYEYLAESIACRSYWFKKKTVGMTGFEAMKYRSTFKIYSPEFMDKMYNTRDRIEQKFSFNAALSGNILKGSQKKGIDSCRTNIDELGE